MHARAAKRLASRRAYVHEFVSGLHYELRYSASVYDLFTAVRQRVDRSVPEVMPDSVRRFDAIYSNLVSDNPEDWSNAVHSCRRILQDLADAVFPAQDEPRVVGEGKQRRTIALGPDNYVNRIACFAEDNEDSARSKDLIGSHLSFLGDRLDAVFYAAQKGSHDNVDRREAERYVVYTYMLVGDILGLLDAT